MTAIAQSYFMTQRHARQLLRQPWFVAMTLIQPVIWLLLFGSLFRRSRSTATSHQGGRMSLTPSQPTTIRANQSGTSTGRFSYRAVQWWVRAASWAAVWLE